MERLDKKDIVAKYSSHIEIQDYTRQAPIDGVNLLELKIMSGEDGSFSEVLRFNDKGAPVNFPEFATQQLNYSILAPGAVKAWHIHFNQEDIWFIPPESNLLVGLYDLRSGSETHDVQMRIASGNHKAHLLYIPRGVAHGVANLSTSSSPLIYLVNQQFDIKDPDERRLPWNVFGSDFWEIKKG